MRAKELTEWRERQRVTQGELARLLGVHIQTVNRWENEAREIPPFLYLALEALDLRQKRKSKK